MLPRLLTLLVISLLPHCLWAHEGHEHHAIEHAEPPASAVAGGSLLATTGAGKYRFRYNSELSVLPEEIAARIKPAHGGFAKTPSGEVFFGLEGTGLIRLSADLREKSIISQDEAIRVGGLHNTTYVDRDGGLLVLPDNGLGRVHVLSLEGEPVGSLGRPEVNAYYADKANGYNPTDTAIGPDGKLYICDGYSPGKYVLTADLDAMAYEDRHFGGRVIGEGREEGKFSTNHGITLGASGRTLVVADRERQWLQELSPRGDFLAGLDLAGANPCDVDFVEWNGAPLAVVGCLVGKQEPGVVQLLRGDQIVATLRPKIDLGLADFQHIHNAAGVVVDGKLYVLCYGWNPGCYAVLEHVAE